MRWWDGQGWTPSITYQSPPLAPLPPAPVVASGGSDQPDAVAGGDGPFPFPARAAWLALFGAGLAIVASGILQAIGTILVPGSTAIQTLFGEFGIWFGFGGACVLASRRFGTGSLVRDFSWRVRTADIGFGAAAAVACLVTAGVIGSAFQGTRFAGSNTSLITNQKGNTVGVAVVTLIAAIGAPVFEELFFRGLLRLSLSSRLGLGAVWVQAGLFGLAHFQPSLGLGNVSVIAAITGLGVVLGYTARLTGRLGADTIAHGLFNLVVTLTIIGVIR